MTSAELQEFLNRDAEESREEKTLVNIARRALTLWNDGYKYSRSLPTLFFIFSPKRGDAYTVDTSDVFAPPSCTCPCFAKRNVCKHLLAVSALLWEEEQAQEAALLAEAEAAEACREFYAEASETYHAA